MDDTRMLKAIINLLDPRTERMGVSKMQHLSSEALDGLTAPIIVEVTGRTTPLAVVIPYSRYLEIQEAMFAFPVE
jgi:hypothetical protein